MALAPGCPRCPEAVAESEPPGSWVCPGHGSVTPLWRSSGLGYEDFASLLVAAGRWPALVPWPLGSGWRISEAGVVSERLDGSGPVRGAVTGCSGSTLPDGLVETLVVVEEPGTGLGGRVAGLGRDDPGPEVGAGTPSARVRVGSQPVALWPVSTSDSGTELDRAAFVGETTGRWLWLVLRPATAALMLAEDWTLHDVSQLGPALVELPFGGRAGPW